MVGSLGIEAASDRAHLGLSVQHQANKKKSNKGAQWF
jgi:hypothetical protein